MSKAFDQTWNLVFLGFGNGGQIALTYASFFEKYSNSLHSIFLFNSYCQNQSFLSNAINSPGYKYYGTFHLGGIYELSNFDHMVVSKIII